jgi:IS605 OrfB family transposase
VSLDVPASTRVSNNRKQGVLGVDFNADHLAVSLTSPDGNFLKAWRFELPVEGKKSGHRASLLSAALGEVIDIALKYKVPVAIEELDFAKKKKDLENKSAGYSRMLSGLMYSKYQQLMTTKCSKAGLELIKVNPAYTSVIGRAKYAKNLGISVHQSAAFVIGRRAQGFHERVPATLKFVVENRVETLHLPVRTNATGPLTNWATIRKSLMESLYQARVNLKLKLRAHRKGQWCGEEPPPRRSSSSPPTQHASFNVEQPQF